MISDERIERAAMAMATKLEWTPPNVSATSLTAVRSRWIDRACAALTADAPEIAAAEIRGQIAEANKWHDHISREQETARTLNPVMALAFGTIRRAIDARIAELKAKTEPTK